jgi:GT2 family glycosyltransferase
VQPARVRGARISVVVPVYNSSTEVSICLGALRGNTLQPFEILVVDDGSTEDVASIARAYGAEVLSTGGRRGPASARNQGGAAARGDIIFFIDVDVVAQPDTLAKVVQNFTDPKVDAAIGSYDNAPAAPQLLSQYRNLMHYYTHQNSARQATTFWSGCGAIRREVFLAVGGFDGSYCKPAIEDIELGYRLISAGYQIVLDYGLQVKHLKRWTLTNMVKTDVIDRGIPWTRLILRAGRMPDDLNLRWAQRASVLLVGVALLLGVYLTLESGGRFVTPAAGILLLSIGSFWVSEAAPPGCTSIRLALALSLGTFGVLAFVHDLELSFFLLLAGYVFLFVREAVGRRQRKWKRWMGLVYGVYLGATFVYMVMQVPHSPFVLALSSVVALNLLLNARFYRFLMLHVGGLRGLALIPFHFLFHLYSGISFALGAIQHYAARRKSI